MSKEKCKICNGTGWNYIDDGVGCIDHEPCICSYNNKKGMVIGSVEAITDVLKREKQDHRNIA